MNVVAARAAGENRARLTMVRLLCAATVWRTAMTQLLPLCGGAAWWVTLIGLLPGFGVAALLQWTMRRTGAQTLTEGIRACWGQVGAWVISLLLAALLLSEGLSSMTALITLFTQGVGSRGTPLTLALLTGCAMLFSMHREGLPRAVHLLRWGIVAAIAVLAGCLLPEVRLDHLLPLYGAGEDAVTTALQVGFGLGWPVVLHLTALPAPGGRLRSAVLPAAMAVGALLLLTLIVPQELLQGQKSLASLLLLPTRYATNGLRVLYLCTIMLVIFLSIAACVHLATEHLCAPMEKRPDWLRYLLLAMLILMQLVDPGQLYAVLAKVQSVLFAVLAGVAMISVLCRRKNA